MDVKHEVELIIGEILGSSVSIENDANLMYDYHMDSLQIMNTVVKLEDKFNFEFELEDLNIDDLIVFSKIVEYVNDILERGVINRENKKYEVVDIEKVIESEFAQDYFKDYCGEGQHIEFNKNFGPTGIQMSKFRKFYT